MEELVACVRIAFAWGGGEVAAKQRHREKIKQFKNRDVCLSSHTTHTHPLTSTQGYTASFTPAQAMTTATRGSAAVRGVRVLVVLSLLLGAMMVQANDKTRPFTRLQSTTGGGADGQQQQQHPQQEELLERQQQRRRRRQQEAASGSDRKSSREGKEGGMMNVSFRRREQPRPQLACSCIRRH